MINLRYGAPHRPPTEGKFAMSASPRRSSRHAIRSAVVAAAAAGLLGALPALAFADGTPQPATSIPVHNSAFRVVPATAVPGSAVEVDLGWWQEGKGTGWRVVSPAFTGPVALTVLGKGDGWVGQATVACGVRPGSYPVTVQGQDIPQGDDAGPFVTQVTVTAGGTSCPSTSTAPASSAQPAAAGQESSASALPWTLAVAAAVCAAAAITVLLVRRRRHGTR